MNHNCIECGNIADAPIEQQSENYPICKNCLSKGWITDPKEVYNELWNDPELRELVRFESPFKKLK
jgi:hypothetical protein